MTEQPLSIKELAAKLRVSVQAVHKMAIKGKWPFETINRRGDKRFIISKLPEHIRLQIAETNTKQIVPYIYNDIKPVGSPDLTDKQNRIALAWADLLKAYLADKKRAKKTKGVSVVKASKLFLDGYNTGHLIPDAFAVLGSKSFSMLEAKAKRYRDSGFDLLALAPQWGTNKGIRKVTDDELHALLSFALHPNRLNISQVTRLTKMTLTKRDIESPSSVATMRRTIDDWKKTNFDKWTLARHGEKALLDRSAPYLERDSSLLEVGDVLVADGHKLNFEALHPFTGKPARLMLVLWYDWASRFPCGWEIMPTEDIQSVAAGLRRAILTLGKMPKIAYLDNGKAFKAKLFTDKTIDFEDAGFNGMFARLGIEPVFAWPYNARAKPVERFFSTFSEFERLQPTFIGTSIADQPARMHRNEKLHQKVHEKRYGGHLPDVEQLNIMMQGWFMEYASRPHRGLNGLLPGEVFKTGLGPGVDEKELRHLMMSMDIKTINRNGVKFMGRNYYDEALYGRKHRVRIKYDLEDLSSILIYEPDGAKLICKAEPLKPVHPMAILGTKDDMAHLKEGIKRNRALMAGTKKAAREFVANAPDLIELPETLTPALSQRERGKTEAALPLTRAEAEHIEAEASKMKVLELKPKEPDPILDGIWERYEKLLERECQGEELDISDMQFMRVTERDPDYAKYHKERFDFLRDLWRVPEEEQAQ